MILAVDQATKSGFACDGEYGLWDLSIKSQESAGVRLLRFKKFLAHYTEKYNIKIVAFERPAGRFKNSIILSSQLIGVGQCYCEENGIEFTMFSAKEIKKHATGNGNASKDDMIIACFEKYGIATNDDNVADAVCMLHCAKEQLGIQ